MNIYIYLSHRPAADAGVDEPLVFTVRTSETPFKLLSNSLESPLKVLSKHFKGRPAIERNAPLNECFHSKLLESTRDLIRDGLRLALHEPLQRRRAEPRVKRFSLMSNKGKALALDEDESTPEDRKG